MIFSQVFGFSVLYLLQPVNPSEGFEARLQIQDIELDFRIGT